MFFTHPGSIAYYRYFKNFKAMDSIPKKGGIWDTAHGLSMEARKFWLWCIWSQIHPTVLDMAREENMDMDTFSRKFKINVSALISKGWPEHGFTNRATQ